MRYNIITSAMDVVFLYILLPKYGMNGYFVSFLITHLLNFLLSLRKLLQISRCKIPFTSPFFCLTAAIIAGWTASYAPGVVIKGLSFLLIFACLLFLLGVLKKEDVLWLRGLLLKKERQRP